MATVVAAATLILGVPDRSEARQAEGIAIAFAQGRVSIAVEKASAAQVLAEWSRIGRTEIVGAELAEARMVAGLKLAAVSESEALAAILGPSFGFVEMVRGVEPGRSSISRLVVGAVRDPEQKVRNGDPSVPPESRFDYYVPEKSAAGGNFGTPVYEKLEAPVPETRFEYSRPDKASGDYGVPVYSPIDKSWKAPEKSFEYFLKEFATVYVVEPPAPTPTTYPEVRFKYYTPRKD